MTTPWRPLVEQGSRALLEGRFGECERLAADASRLGPDEAAPGLLAAVACREQGRAAEAEILVRRLLARHPAVEEAQALLGAVLADLGRDGEARRQLDLLEAWLGSVTATLLAAEIAHTLDSFEHAEILSVPLEARAAEFAGCHGAVARHLGLVCHVLGRWDDAERHYRSALDLNRAAGAPVLVAHTRRHLSGLLRARSADGDWERAVEELGRAAAIYRRLEIERLAEEAEVVLRRSQVLTSPDGSAASAVNVFRRIPGGWELAYGDRRAVVDDLAGLGHIATLLAAAGRPVHVVDLVDGRALGDQVAEEYRSRLEEVAGQLTATDPVAAALARAERDVLAAELSLLNGAASSTAVEGGDRARRLVALRIRSSLERLDDVLPVLARHLRCSVRTGTFCIYEPERPERWRMEP